MRPIIEPINVVEALIKENKVKTFDDFKRTAKKITYIVWQIIAPLFVNLWSYKYSVKQEITVPIAGSNDIGLWYVKNNDKRLIIANKIGHKKLLNSLYFFLNPNITSLSAPMVQVATVAKINAFPVAK